MVRNLISNALKYTQRGRVLLGCRRRQGKLRIEIWDTGIGIPESELQAVFEEYYQVDNAARQRSQGLGLGLSIVKSLGELLHHPIRVRSLQGKGSVFSIEVPLAPGGHVAAPVPHPSVAEDASTHAAPRTGAILIIEDDPEVREHLELFLNDEGYQVSTAVDGPAALEALAHATTRPDLVLADYNLPNGMNGVQVSQKLSREARSTNSIHHSHRRHLDRHPARYRPSRLRSSPQARQTARSDARNREAPGEAAGPARLGPSSRS